MKYKLINMPGGTRTLDETKQVMLEDFQKPKPESQCIIEIKEIKQQPREKIWDYDHVRIVESS